MQDFLSSLTTNFSADKLFQNLAPFMPWMLGLVLFGFVFWFVRKTIKKGQHGKGA